MIKRIPLKIEHVFELLENPDVNHGEDIKSLFTGPNVPPVDKMEDCYSIVDAYGQVLACCGLAYRWKDRAEAWTIFKPNMGAKLVAVARHFKEFLHSHPCKRIEVFMDPDFVKSHTWLTFLGFKLEAAVVSKFKDNKDYSLYALVKEN